MLSKLTGVFRQGLGSQAPAHSSIKTRKASPEARRSGSVLRRICTFQINIKFRLEKSNSSLFLRTFTQKAEATFFMRIRLVFSILRNNGLLPFHQQSTLHTFFKRHLDRFPKEVLYEPIQMSFSGIKGHSIVHKDGLEYDSPKITIVVSSPYKFLIEELVDEIFSWPSFDLDCLVVKPSQVLIELPPDFDQIESYVCLSPLAVRYLPANELENKKHLNPEEISFSRILWDSTLSKVKASGFFSEAEWKEFPPISVTPDADYLRKCLEMNRKISRMYALPSQNAGSEIRAYTFPFQLNAHPEIHKFLFYCGLGAFTQCGFGMLDLANKNHRVMVKEYPVRRP